MSLCCGRRSLRFRCSRWLEAVQGRGVLAIFKEDCNGLVYRNAFSPFRDEQLSDRAFIDRLNLHRRLVGFDLGNHIARRNIVALLDKPTGERPFRHGR